MIKKTLRNAVAGTAAAGAMILPAATTVAPQMELMACEYPDSVVTTTNIVAPAVIKQHTTHTATVDVDAGNKTPRGTVVFKIKQGRELEKKVSADYDGSPVSFSFGGAFDSGKNYKLKAKFFGNCKFRNSSDAMVVTVVKG